MNDDLLALVRKKESSLIKTIKLLETNKVDAIVSPGSTKLLISAIHLFLSKNKLIPKIALMPSLPTQDVNKKLFLLDVGANLENTSEDLFNFAIMADTYYQVLNQNQKPKIGLLNIGTEDNKGRELELKTFNMLVQHFPEQFIGNIEARDVLLGHADILLCDGYTGNICLKSLEGMGGMLFKLLQQKVKQAN